MTAAAAAPSEQASSTLRLYHSFARLPLGAWLFSRALCFKAPYFSSIRPRIRQLKPGLSEWKIKNRRSVRNHLGTVHALAMGNLAELCAGTLMEASLPSRLRWIPKGMQIEYLKKATTDLVATAVIADPKTLSPGNYEVEVMVKNTHGEAVSRAVITMWLSEKNQHR
ncbi:hotdog fold domain-containing protein [Hahella sp. NBU794]|uniref:hotdog fold domain-containing protein n=1 Tax=Hahella sp. NBU794 TaxID=3422590 RepID=UPI003D6EFE61